MLMERFDKTWREAFNQPEFDKEKWNSPSSSLFDKIEEEVAKDEQPKGFWFTVLGITLLVAALILLVIILSSSSESVKKTNTLDSTSSIVENTYNTQSNTNQLVDNIETTPSKPFVESDPEVKTSLYNIKEINTKTLVVQTIQETSHNRRNQENTSNKNDLFISENSNIPDFTPISWNEKLAPSPTIDFRTIQSHKIIPSVTLKETSSFQKKTSPIYIGLFSQYVLWDDILNPNYQSALQDADFYSSETKAFNFSLDIEKPLSNRISIFSAISYERISIESGHNSTLFYSSDSMGSLSNTFDLDMASPYGFMQSEILLTRNASSTINENIDLGLSTQHEISNLDLNLGLRLKLIQHNRSSIRLSTALGLNYLVKIENTFKNCLVGNSDLVYDQGSIISDQQNLNRVYLSTYLGVEYNYQINTLNALTFRTSWKEGLGSIYSEDSFSTKTRRVYFGIGLIRKIGL